MDSKIFYYSCLFISSAVLFLSSEVSFSDCAYELERRPVQISEEDFFREKLFQTLAQLSANRRLIDQDATAFKDLGFRNPRDGKSSLCGQTVVTNLMEILLTAAGQPHKVGSRINFLSQIMTDLANNMPRQTWDPRYGARVAALLPALEMRYPEKGIPAILRTKSPRINSPLWFSDLNSPLGKSRVSLIGLGSYPKGQGTVLGKTISDHYVGVIGFKDGVAKIVDPASPNDPITAKFSKVPVTFQKIPGPVQTYKVEFLNPCWYQSYDVYVHVILNVDIDNRWLNGQTI